MKRRQFSTYLAASAFASSAARAQQSGHTYRVGELASLDLKVLMWCKRGRWR